MNAKHPWLFEAPSTSSSAIRLVNPYTNSKSWAPEWKTEWNRLPPPDYDIIESDDRVLMTNTRSAPFRYICKLEGALVDLRTGAPKGRFGCTGTLIAPNKVLTAAHCILGPGFGKADKIRVIPGKNGPGNTLQEEPFGFALAQRMDVPEAWRAAPNMIEAPKHLDYGVITLDRPIGHQVGWWRRIEPMSDDFLLRYKVNTAGYPGDKGGKHLYHAYDSIVKVQSQRLEFLLDILRGQSGSPIWTRWRNSIVIVGIVNAIDDKKDSTIANTGVRITPSVLSDIRRWLAT